MVGLSTGGSVKCPSCTLSISNAVSALSYYISDLFNSYTSNILP